MFLTKKINAGMVVLFLVSSFCLIAQQPDEEIQQLYEEFQMINQQLEMVQRQVYQDPEVTELAENFYSLMDKKMIEADPEAEKLLSDIDKISEDIQKAQQAENREQFQELQQEYQQKNGQLQTIRQAVSQDPEILSKQKELEDLFMKKMEEIEPETPKMIERLEEINEQFEKLMGQQ